MNKAEAIILLVLCLFIGGCLELSKNGLPGISKDVPKVTKKKTDKTIYKSVIPGVTVGKYTIGGVYISEAMAGDIFEKIQLWLLGLAAILFVGMLVGLGLLWFQQPIGADIAVLGGSFSLLTAVTAVWSKFVLITVGLAILVGGVYWLFVLWRKYSDEKLQKELVKSHDDHERNLEDLELGWMHKRKIRKLKG